MLRAFASDYLPPQRSGWRDVEAAEPEAEPGK